MAETVNSAIRALPPRRIIRMASAMNTANKPSARARTILLPKTDRSAMNI